MADPPRACVDCDVLIDYFTDTEDQARLDGARWFLEAVQRGVYRLVLPASVIPEMVGTPVMRPQAAADHQRRAERVERFLDWVRDSRPLIVDIDPRVAYDAARLAQEYDLKGGDAMVLASALAARASVLYTWDHGLLKQRVRDAVSPLVVQGPVPVVPPQQELDVTDTESSWLPSTDAE